ncbi:MAG: caspase family protein, partial [Phormidesmis sp.]
MKFKRCLAIVVAIDSYEKGISPLKTPVSDAQAIAELLRSQHDYEVLSFIDKGATQSALEHMLTHELPQLVSKDDCLLFYFAGHGIARNSEDGPEDGPKGYLIPQDAKLDDVDTYIPMTKVHDALHQLPCRHFLGILDCCFAGSFRWSSIRDIGMAESGILHKERFDRFIQDPAWQIITSAAHDQKALDSLRVQHRGQVGQHSPFAAALIGALQGKADTSPPAEKSKPAGDGVITASELYVYLRDCVETTTETHAIRQTPGIHQLKKHDKGEYIFFTPGHSLNLPPAPPLDESKNPYRGLQPFEEKHSRLFFGRDSLKTALKGFVEKNPLTVVLGASGSGKSSLIKAGLIPDLMRQKDEDKQWYVLPPIRPGESPFQALNEALAKVHLPTVDRQNSQKTLTHSVTAWTQNHPQARLLIVIDQSEELITLCSDESDRQNFFQQILTAVDTHRHTLRIVLSLRSDFESQVRDAGIDSAPKALGKLGHTALKKRWQRGRFVVPAMTRGELREAIEKPAEALVIHFQPHDLVEQLIDEVADMPGALPLLSFALSELYLKYLKRQQQAKLSGNIIDRALTQADYQALGGVIQSLTQRADEEFQALVQENPAYGPMIRQVMLRMVAIGGGELARRRVPLSELEYPVAKNDLVKAVVQRFSQARLLVEGQDAEGRPYIEPAHDALASGWGKLVTWQREAEESLILQRRLTPAAEEWQVQKKARFLWNANPRLDLLKQELTADSSWLNKLETEFVAQSIRRKSFNTRVYWGIALSVIAGLSLFTLWALSEQRKTVIAQADSSRQAAQTGLQSNELTLDNVVQSLQAAKATENWLLQVRSPEKALQAEVLATLRNAVYLNQEQARWQISPDEVVRATFMGQGRKLALVAQRNGQAICLRDLESDLEGDLQCEDLPKGIELLTEARFSPDGQKIAWAAGWNPSEPDAGELYVWDTENQQFYRQPITTSQFEFSPDSQSLVFIKSTQNEKSSISKWVWENGQISSPTTFQGAISGFAFKPDGYQLMATGGEDAKEPELSLWEQSGSSWKLLRKLPVDFPPVHSVAISPKGNSLVMTYGGGRSMGASRELWRTGSETPTVLGAISVVAYAPDESRMAVAQDDGTIQLFYSWGGPPTELKGHRGLVSSLSFSDDGKQLLTTGSDSTIRLWNMEAQVNAQQLTPHQKPNQKLPNPVQAISFSPDSKQIATLESGTIHLRSVSSPQQSLQHFSKLEFNEDSQLLFHPQGKQLAITEPVPGSSRSTVHFLDLRSGEVSPLPDEYESVGSLSFSPDGEELAIFEALGDGDNQKSTVHLLNLKNMQEQKIEDTQRQRSAVWKESGQLLGAVSIVFSDSVDIWDLFSNQQLASLTIGQSARRYLSRISFSGDGNLAVVQIGQITTLWDWQNNLSFELNHGYSDANKVKLSEISSDGSILAVVNEQDMVELLPIGELDELVER